MIRDIGLLRPSRKRVCLSIKSGAQAWTGADVDLGSVEDRCSNRRFATALSTINCEPFNHGENDATYRLDAGKLSRAASISRLSATINSILRGNVRGIVGSNEFSFRSCTSMEGIHFTIWSGEALTGKRLWHAYYYLGYDTEPTCKEAEFKD